MEINKIMGKNRLKREPFDKKFLGGEAKYFNGKTPFCLLSLNACLCYYVPYIYTSKIELNTLKPKM